MDENSWQTRSNIPAENEHSVCSGSTENSTQQNEDKVEVSGQFKLELAQTIVLSSLVTGMKDENLRKLLGLL